MRGTRPTLAGVATSSVHFGGIVAVDGATLHVERRRDRRAHRDQRRRQVDADERRSVASSRPRARSAARARRSADRSPAYRASLGLGRTFQAATLFPELTVNETLLVALEAKGRVGHALDRARPAPGATPRPGCAGRGRPSWSTSSASVGTGTTTSSDLSTGTRRVVELAGLLALDAKVLCLDEPTAGLAQRETEAFGPLIVTVQKELGASVLLIEHDMPLIMGICDRVYCLEAGPVIAEGAPAQVRDDPRVIASYLGTDERAIVRSGAAAPTNAVPTASSSAVVTPLQGVRQDPAS